LLEFDHSVRLNLEIGVDRSAFSEVVLKPLSAFSNDGDATNTTGTRLIGFAPHIAPKAYLHAVYAPLGVSELAELQTRLRREIPRQFAEFLSHANGLSIFVAALRVFGYVPVRLRTGTGASVYDYPYDIVVPNVSARLRGLRNGSLAIGWYKGDGSYASIEGDGKVRRFDPRNEDRVNEMWPDFDTWIASEIARFIRERAN
jgi:hypothetical protein